MPTPKVGRKFVHGGNWNYPGRIAVLDELDVIFVYEGFPQIMCPIIVWDRREFQRRIEEFEFLPML